MSEEDREPVAYQDGEQLYVVRNGRFVPTAIRMPGRRPKYPLHELEVGESFFIPFTSEKVKTLSFLSHRAKKLQIKIKQKVLTEQGQRGVRVWRVE